MTSRPVYSTELGRLCPGCGKAVAACICKPAARAAGDGVVRVGRETGGRKGKAVTLIKGLPLDDAALQALAKQLKAACGSGGTVKDGVIEIQGEHIERVMAWLAARPECAAQGWKIKRAGG